MLIIEMTLTEQELDALNHTLTFCFESDIYERIKNVISKNSDLLNQGQMFLDYLWGKIRSKIKFPNTFKQNNFI